TFKIAIIDDDLIIRTMLTQIMNQLFEKEQNEIRPFNNGADFFMSNWYMDHDTQYLIVLDGIMPKMDGFEVLHKIRSLPHQDQFKVVMLTSRVNEKSMSLARKFGVDEFITKPFDILD